MGEAGTVLVVDDEPQLLRLLVRVFEKRGFRVLSALDADAAAEIFDRHHAEIDAALLDIVIPPAGVEPLLSRMLGLREDVGVVLTSGDELPPALGERLEALGGVFLRKPFSPDVARAALLQVMA
jgi:two-component system sensor histidine kinase RpfC